MNSKTFNFKETVFYAIPTMCVDLLLHIQVLRYVNSVFYFWDPADLVMTARRTVYFLVVSYLMAIAICPIRFYKRGIRARFILRRAFVQTFLTLSFFAISVFLLFGSFAGKLLLQEGILATACIALWHLLFKAVILAMRRRGRNKVHVVIVGDNENARQLAHTITNWADYSDYKIVATFGEEPEAIAAYLADNKVHEVYCSINPALHADMVNAIIRQCENLFIDFYYVPNMEGYLHRTMTYRQMGPMTVVKWLDEPLANPLNILIKRTFDIAVSALFLLTLYPFIWLFVAIGTKLSSPGPILFRQKRTGYKARPFTMYKFRSMRVNADADKLQATEDDPRKTRFGDFLRRTSLDEVPQFINVLLGDMSLIGPRPHMELHTEIYTQLVDEYLVRHMVKPGLTGWAQVNGCRGETKTTAMMAERVRYDIWYIEHWSVSLDVKILLMTVLQILRGDQQAY
ncbi:MAG: exopolysaccharide biosynthesis polyprenyl glycosylphosphotransferase [Bacteroidales bacterium]|nr:exopolysaccharide biosynthesis polyprenyl glycosylphosphotransferase [Bacteroidales bacterium]